MWKNNMDILQMFYAFLNYLLSSIPSSLFTDILKVFFPNLW